MADEHLFDFLDPADVVRACHIIPSFTSKRKHSGGPGVSACAGDKDDRREYYVNRFVDHDMLMCFHFGLGVGHIYSHHSTLQSEPLHGASARQAVIAHDIEVPIDNIEVTEGNIEDKEDDEDNEAPRSGGLEQQFGSSNKSLLSQFNEMYDSELELDYEN
ncbi:hypothetical protein EDB19DRAFT_1904794 [Suillus lakei]|nr:hypothetical protein EDB19DRAFT_1904794 [Suillus lakei]